MYLHGITERLRQAPLRLAVPSLLNVTAHSLSKKIDDLRLPVLNYRWTSCITIISKPRLHESKGASEPTAHLKKKKGGGLLLLKNKTWSTNLEFLVLKGRPFPPKCEHRFFFFLLFTLFCVLRVPHAQAA